MGNKIVAVPGIGTVSFPDSMSDGDINSAIDQQLNQNKPKNFASMSPQDLAAQAMRNSGVTGTQRLAPTAPRVNMQEQPTMAGAYANSVADNFGQIKKFHSALGQDVVGAVKGAGDMLVNGGADPNTMAQYMARNIAQSNHPMAAAFGANGDAIAKSANPSGANNQVGTQPPLDRSFPQPDYASLAGHAALPLATAMIAGRTAKENAPTASDLGIPTRAHAIEGLKSVESAVGGIPIDVNAPGQVAMRTQELAASGGQMPKVVRDFMKRVTDPTQGPLTVSEARDFYKNATRLSSGEFNNLTPVMQRQAGDFAHTLNESIANAADQAGKKAQYLDSMGEYAAASKMRNRAETLKQISIKLAKGAGYGAATAAGAYTTYEALK